MLFFFKQFDLISQKPTLLINNSERIRSLYGALLTVVLVTLTLLFAAQFLYELFSRENPSVLFYEELDQQDVLIDLNYSTFPIFISIQAEDTSSDLNFNNFFQFEVFLRKIKMISANSIPEYEELTLNYSTCSFTDQLALYKDVFESNFMPNKFNCLTFQNGTTNSNNNPVLKTRNRKIIQNDELLILIKPCTGINCPVPSSDIQNVIQNSNLHFIFGYIEKKLNFIDPTPPSSAIPTPKYIKQRLDTEITQNWDVNLKRETFSSDFGYLLNDSDSEEFVTIDKFIMVTGSKRQWDGSPAGSDSGLVNISLKINDIFKKVYKRSFYKGQNFFAEIGGVFNFLFIIAYHLNLIYSVINFNLTIDNNVKLSYYAEKVLNNFNFLFFRKLSKFEEV